MTEIYYNAATFGSVYWFDLCATVAGGIELTYPQLPPFKTCVFDVLAKHRGAATDLDPRCGALPAGMFASEAARYVPNDAPDDFYRLNYYLGGPDVAGHYVHPEHDRPLTDAEEEELAASHSAALQRVTAWLTGCRQTADGAGAVYDIRGHQPAGVFNYPNRIPQKRIVGELPRIELV